MNARLYRTENWVCGIVQAADHDILIAPLCRALVMAGYEDGRLEFTDERGRAAFSVASILAAADPPKRRKGKS